MSRERLVGTVGGVCSAVLLCTLVATPADAAASGSPRIQEVFFDLEAGSVRIVGHRFDRGRFDPPHVRLGASRRLLETLETSAEEIVARIPEGLPPGNYRLVVRTAPWLFTTFDAFTGDVQPTEQLCPEGSVVIGIDASGLVCSDDAGNGGTLQCDALGGNPPSGPVAGCSDACESLEFVGIQTELVDVCLDGCTRLESSAEDLAACASAGVPGAPQPEFRCGFDQDGFGFCLCLEPATAGGFAACVSPL